MDSRDGSLGEGNRTDCIIIASLNNETKEIKLVSVYRDTLLGPSEGTYQKCNAAYSYGGPVLAINMLNMNLDLDIEDYVTVDFGAIADAIDLLGGVEIDVTDEEADTESVPSGNGGFCGNRGALPERRRPFAAGWNAGYHVRPDTFHCGRGFYPDGAAEDCT